MCPIDYVSVLIALGCTLGAFILYKMLFHTTDNLRLTYKYTAQNHILVGKLPLTYRLPLWCKSTLFQITYILSDYLKGQLDQVFSPYNDVSRIPCAISKNEMLLHWKIHQDAEGETQKLPTLIIFPGLTGSSGENYIRSLVHSLGGRFHVCVVNRIGCGESELTDPKVTFMSNWESVDRVVQTVYDRMNGSVPVEEAQIPIFAIGFSLGGHNLVKYLTKPEYGPSKLKGAMSVSQVFDIAQNSQRIEQIHPYYMRILTKSLIRFVHRNENIYRKFANSNEHLQFSLDKVYACKSIPEWDRAVVQSIQGMKDLDLEYYQVNAITEEDLLRVNIPLFILHANDDPVCSVEGLPMYAPLRNDNIIIGTTNHGTHCGFVKGGFVRPSFETYCDELVRKFFEGILELDQHYHYEVDEYD